MEIDINIPMNFKLDSLCEKSFELVHKWINLLDSNILRTTQKLTKEMQNNFYHNEICNRNSKHRYIGMYGNMPDVNYSPLIEAGASWSISLTRQVYPGSTGSPFPDK